MSKIVKVIPNDDYTLLIEFEPGDQVLLNMQGLIKTRQYASLMELECFKNLVFEDKAIYWSSLRETDPGVTKTKLTMDSIFYMLNA